MSKVIKIVCVVVAIAVIGLAVFFIFFGKDSNLSVYNKINSVLQYKYNLDIYGDLSGLDKLGYAGNTQDFNDSEYEQILTIRQRLFTVDDTLKTGLEDSVVFEYYGYAKYESILTDGIKYYSNYAVLANNAPKRRAKVINSYVSNYKTSIAKLYDQSTLVATMQNEFGSEESQVSEQELLVEYENLRDMYRNYLKSASRLLTELRDYVVTESFDNTYYFETISVLYDSVAETIITAMNSKLEQEINYLHDASIYVDKLYEYVETGYINYGISDEVGYLIAYNEMYYHDRKDYDSMFEFTHFQKYDLIHGNNNISASIAVGYAEYSAIVIGLLEL